MFYSCMFSGSAGFQQFCLLGTYICETKDYISVKIFEISSIGYVDAKRKSDGYPTQTDQSKMTSNTMKKVNKQCLFDTPAQYESVKKHGNL